MSFTTPVTIAGRTVQVLLFTPDAKDGIEIIYKFATILPVGRTGRESRWPRWEAPRLEQRLALDLTAAKADELRRGIAALGAELVAVPLWIDQLTGAQWADRIHSPQWAVRLSDGAVVAGGGAMSPGEVYAPLLLGRWAEQPDLTPYALDRARVEIALEEESPWSARVQINGAVSDSEFPDLAPAYTAMSDRSHSFLSFDEIGDGRERAVDGTEAPLAWVQEAKFQLRTRDEIRTLLAFFQAQRGRWGSFDSPVWFRPGDATPETPHVTKVRFRNDKLTVKYHGASASCSVSLQQVPWEIAGVAGETPKQRPKAHLYRFTVGTPTPQISRFTAYERPITVSGDGTYQPANMEHDAIRSSMSLDNLSVTFTSDRFDGNPLSSLAPWRSEAQIAVEIFEADPDAPDAATLVWAGTCGEPKAEGRRIKVKALFLGGLLDRQFPNVTKRRSCNVALFSVPCGLNPADWRVVGTLSSAVGTVLTVATSDTRAANFYAFGKVWVGTGETIEQRLVVGSAPVSGGQQLTINKALAQVASAQAVQLWPGCLKRYDEDCIAKFGNGPRFVGLPHAPNYNPSLAAVSDSQSQKK